MRHARPVILLADDDEGLLAALSTRFEHLGFECVLARSGAQALSLSRQHDPDVIVTDLSMPAGSGIAFVQTLRGENDVPVAVLTGHKDDFRQEIAELEFVWILHKPCEFTTLRAVIDTHLRSTDTSENKAA